MPVVLRNEDFGRISRILGDGTPVRLEFNIVNQSYPEGRTSAQHRGGDPRHRQKGRSGDARRHLDSWHSATGATDNAIGCAVMMEAARILKAIGVQPRRTIRVALWSGEEQGLLGSKAYVKEHFGTYENQKPEFAKFAGYFNVDSGTGRIRGASVFGPDEAAAVLREALAPFADLGVMGASSTRSRRTGGTDSTSFNEAGLPGIGLSQGSHRVRQLPGTPTSTPTSASSRTTFRNQRSRLPPPCITWRCATRCCRGSVWSRCRRRRRRRRARDQLENGSNNALPRRPCAPGEPRGSPGFSDKPDGVRVALEQKPKRKALR